MTIENQCNKILLRILLSFIFAILTTGFVFLSPAFSQTIGELPKPEGRVSDYAGVIDPATRSRLENQLNQFRERSSPSVEIAIAVVKTTGESPIFDYSMALARKWGIGSTNDNNPGALLFIAIDDRRYQTQISRDLESELPDGVVGAIQRQFLVPQFKDGRYGKGIEDTITAFIRTIENRRGITRDASSRPKITLPRFLQIRPESLVSDFHGILDTPTKTVMNRYLEEFRDTSDPAVNLYVTIVETTGGIPAEDFSYAIANAWKLDIENDSGRNVLLFISMTDKSYFTRVGRGLSKELPRSSVDRIENNLLEYAFSPYSGEYNTAISKTVNAYVRGIDPTKPEVDLTLGNPDGFRSYDSVFHYLIDNCVSILVGIFFLGVLLWIVWEIVKSAVYGDNSGTSGGTSGSSYFDTGSSSSSSSWGSGDSSGGFGGFGGGGDFGGGGAGGSW